MITMSIRSFSARTANALVRLLCIWVLASPAIAADIENALETGSGPNGSNPDDLLAVCGTLRLAHPMLTGLSDGGIFGLLAALSSPESFRALVLGGAVPPSPLAKEDHVFKGMRASEAESPEDDFGTSGPSE